VRQVAFSQMGLAFLELRRYDEAAASYRNALSFDPDDEWSLVGSGIVALQARNFPLAYAQFSHAAQANSSPTSYLLLAQALRRGGQPADADRALAQAQRLSPNLTQPQKDAAAFLSFAGLELL
jgi:tetratricopeptide (TPR) repeat protein